MTSSEVVADATFAFLEFCFFAFSIALTHTYSDYTYHLVHACFIGLENIFTTLRLRNLSKFIVKIDYIVHSSQSYMQHVSYSRFCQISSCSSSDWVPRRMWVCKLVLYLCVALDIRDVRLGHALLYFQGATLREEVREHLDGV